MTPKVGFTLNIWVIQQKKKSQDHLEVNNHCKSQNTPTNKYILVLKMLGDSYH